MLRVSSGRLMTPAWSFSPVRGVGVRFQMMRGTGHRRRQVIVSNRRRGARLSCWPDADCLAAPNPPSERPILCVEVCARCQTLTYEPEAGLQRARNARSGYRLMGCRAGSRIMNRLERGLSGEAV